MDNLEVLRMAGEKPRGQAIPRFFVETVENAFASEKDGRPRFVEEERVEIIIPGDLRSRFVQRVDDEVKLRFAKEYEAFKEGISAPLEGTPLSEWAMVSRSQVLELAHFHIHTLEQLAGVNDSHLQNLGMGARELREKAKVHLQVTKDGMEPLARLVDENIRLRDENERLKSTVAEQAVVIKSLQPEEVMNARRSAQ
jgi:hypothetical protein